MNSKRPLLLWLMLLALALLALTNALQVIQTLQSWNWLEVFGYSPSPIYPVFQGVFFMLLFGVCLVMLWALAPLAPILTGVSFAVYLVWSWVDRLWITLNPVPFSNHLLAAGVSLGVFLLAEFSLYLLAPFMRQVTPEVEKEGKNGRSEPGS